MCVGNRAFRLTKHMKNKRFDLKSTSRERKPAYKFVNAHLPRPRGETNKPKTLSSSHHANIFAANAAKVTSLKKVFLFQLNPTKCVQLQVCKYNRFLKIKRKTMGLRNYFAEYTSLKTMDCTVVNRIRTYK